MGLLTFEGLAATDLAKSEQRNAARTVLAKVASTAADRQFDIFLSHASLDAQVVLQLLKLVENHGFSAYVDWIDDANLDRTMVTNRTTGILRMRMQNCTCLLYAFSDNAKRSAWMPWELGFFDGVKEGRAVIAPIVNAISPGQYAGREYLGIYPYLTLDNDRSDESRLWVGTSRDKYVELGQWLKGEQPHMHG